MSKHLDFHERGWNDYLYWQTQDKKTLKKVNELIRDIVRSGYEGIGKPEPLKGELFGWWSRRIDETNRLVYRLAENDEILEILQCRGHYNGLSAARNPAGFFMRFRHPTPRFVYSLVA